MSTASVSRIPKCKYQYSNYVVGFCLPLSSDSIESHVDKNAIFSLQMAINDFEDGRKEKVQREKIERQICHALLIVYTHSHAARTQKHLPKNGK